MRAGLACFSAVLLIDQADAAGHRAWRNLTRSVFLQQDPQVRDSAFPNVGISECTCSCCEVSERTPEEIEDQAIYLKCAQKFTDVGEECTRKCAITNNLVLPAGTSDKGINYDRFCFYYCQPFDSAVTGPCVRQNAAEASKTAIDDGNGQDTHLSPQGSSDIVEPHKPTEPPKPPTMEEMPCEERANCIEKPMKDAHMKAEQTWELARNSARAARGAANGEDPGDTWGAHEDNPGPGVITEEETVSADLPNPLKR